MNQIYIIPTTFKSLTIDALKRELRILNSEVVSITLRGCLDPDIDILTFFDVVEIGEECEFRFHKREWSAAFIGKVLSYGWLKYNDAFLKDVFLQNAKLNFYISITGGLDNFDNQNERRVYFDFFKAVARIFEGLIFIDPEAELNNRDYYNTFKKRLYTLEDFSSYIFCEYGLGTVSE